MRRYLTATFLFLSMLLAAGGCSVRQVATDTLADTLATNGRTFSSDDDPELVRAAAPFGLKLIESTLAAAPQHRGLLLAAARGFTQYSLAFVEQDALQMEKTDVAAAAVLRARAKRLFLRARDYGLRGMETSHPDFLVRLRRNPVATLQAIGAEDTGLLFWTGVAWSSAAVMDSADLELIADLPLAAKLVERALELDEGYDCGGPHDYFIAYEMYRPGGEGEAAARRHFERAVELCGGALAAPYVMLAEAVTIRRQQKTEFVQLLNRALAIDPDAHPDYGLANRITQRRARWLLDHVEDYFAE
jgi:predicted anti-sigma-YlaC factor YlaD